MDENLNELPFEFRKKKTDPNLQRENWKAIETAMAERKRPARMFWMRAIAVAAILAIAFGAVWYWQDRPVAENLTQISTAYGELRQITLPDGSQIVLNANSTLTFPANWPEKGDRQIWLDGEAYFHVTKHPITNQKFIVHTSQIDIEVLGTKFNVNSRHQQSIVSLEEGKVQLTVNGKLQELIEAKQPAIMKPGEVAVINEAHKVAVNTDRIVTYRSGWSRNEYHFDNTPLSEIAKMIRDNYGYTMQSDDESLFDKKISGDLRAASIQELVKVLEITCGIRMKIENKTIRLQSL